MQKRIKSCTALKGEFSVAADKSISHRAVIFSALARGEGIVRNFLPAEDTLSSCACLRQLGVNIETRGDVLLVEGPGLNGLLEPAGVLDCGNSGTTMRLLTGLLSGRPFFSVLSGDQSLNQRPMKRVITPLLAMGASISGRKNSSCAPLAIQGGAMEGINYELPVASAQVKSALLLAGLSAGSQTVLTEPVQSRDHSERMLAAMGADIKVEDLTIRLIPGQELQPQEFMVPGDISSAAFFLVAGTLVPDSELMIKNVGINPSRAGIIEVLQAMGARISLDNQKTVGGEPVADILVVSSDLHAIHIDGEIIPRLIDELPVIAVAMAAAQGESKVNGAHELRVKETDRITAICSELGKMGVNINELEDGFVIQGNRDQFKGNCVDSRGDHRIAMSLAVAGLIAAGETLIEGAEAVNISFPAFWNLLERLSKA
ncbi:MAG: 3-phosphoshikimate 1-carboxyvinyltransferase [Syntrophomonadaceae bacterium]|nr:3-phosphoshikimate 1-carboxyvinyltransferase [Syntrophomonadaceae bacterium]